MKAVNREVLNRAVGIIEGASYCAAQRVTDALALALELIDSVIRDEQMEDEE